MRKEHDRFVLAKPPDARYNILRSQKLRQKEFFSLTLSYFSALKYTYQPSIKMITGLK